MDGEADIQARQLRQRAAALLQDAALCSNPAQCDHLSRQALALLRQARILLDEAEQPGLDSSIERMH